MSNLHPFEKAGLGRAPFRCTGVTKQAYQACQGAPVQPGSSCDYCGTGIMYVYAIEGADGSKFKVGCDCVAKTGARVEGFEEQRKGLQQAQRTSRRTARAEARKAQWAKEKQERDAARAEEFTSANATLIQGLLAYQGDGFLGEMRDQIKRCGYLTPNQTTSAAGALDRHARQETDKAGSQHVGAVGERVEGEFEVVATKSWESDYGWPRRMVHWNLLRKDGRDLCTYKGQLLGATGEKFRAKFTVKEHEVYQGARQTKLQRPKFLDEVVAKG